MSELRTFFRFCPSCGKRFHITLVRKEIVKVDRKPAEEEKVVLPINEQSTGFGGPVPVYLEEGHPVVVDIEEYRYVYRCKHCGHQWTEKHIEEEEERR